MTLLVISIFANVLKVRLKIISSWIRIGPKSNQSVLKGEKGEDTRTHRRRPRAYRGRYWSDESTRQGMSRIEGYHQKLGERQGMDSSSEPLKGTNVISMLISEL